MNYTNLNLKKIGLHQEDGIFRNLPHEMLIEDTVLRKEGRMGLRGAVMVDTGKYTGRSPKDKYFVVEPGSSQNLWWGTISMLM